MAEREKMSPQLVWGTGLCIYISREMKSSSHTSTEREGRAHLKVRSFVSNRLKLNPSVSIAYCASYATDDRLTAREEKSQECDKGQGRLCIKSPFALLPSTGRFMAPVKYAVVTTPPYHGLHTPLAAERARAPSRKWMVRGGDTVKHIKQNGVYSWQIGKCNWCWTISRFPRNITLWCLWLTYLWHGNQTANSNNFYLTVSYASFTFYDR